MTTDLARLAKQEGIRYFLICFADLFGTLRSKLVPARAIGDMQRDGAGFAGFAAWLDMTPADPDMFALPDAESLVRLPWKPEVAWLPANLWMNGREVEASPRIVLERQVEMLQSGVTGCGRESSASSSSSTRTARRSPMDGTARRSPAMTRRHSCAATT